MLLCQIKTRIKLHFLIITQLKIRRRLLHIIKHNPDSEKSLRNIITYIGNISHLAELLIYLITYIQNDPDSSEDLRKIIANSSITPSKTKYKLEFVKQAIKYYYYSAFSIADLKLIFKLIHDYTDSITFENHQVLLTIATNHKLPQILKLNTNTISKNFNTCYELIALNIVMQYIGDIRHNEYLRSLVCDMLKIYIDQADSPLIFHLSTIVRDHRVSFNSFYMVRANLLNLNKIHNFNSALENHITSSALRDSSDEKNFNSLVTTKSKEKLDIHLKNTQYNKHLRNLVHDILEIYRDQVNSPLIFRLSKIVSDDGVSFNSFETSKLRLLDLDIIDNPDNLGDAGRVIANTLKDHSNAYEIIGKIFKHPPFTKHFKNILSIILQYWLPKPEERFNYLAEIRLIEQRQKQDVEVKDADVEVKVKVNLNVNEHEEKLNTLNATQKNIQKVNNSVQEEVNVLNV